MATATRLWWVRFYQDRDDAAPSRTGYIRAASEDEAADIAQRLMHDGEMRVDVVRVMFRPNLRLSPGDLLNPED